jgi:hypothetical protein
MRARCIGTGFYRRDLAIAATASAATVTTAAASSAPAATTTTAAVTSAPATSASSTVATTTAASTAALTLRTSFVHDQRAAQEILAIERFDRFVRFGVVAYFGETETARLSRETIAQKRERIGLHADF